MREVAAGWTFRTLASLLAAVGCAWGPVLASTDSFPDPDPTTAAQAIALLCPDPASRALCVRAHFVAFHPSAIGDPTAVRRATEMLVGRRTARPTSDTIDPSGIVIRLDTESASPRLDAPSRNGSDGAQALVHAASTGLEQARSLLVGRLELPAPQISELLITELGHGVDGFFVPGRGRSGVGRIVLDSTSEAGRDGLRRAAIRQYAYACAVEMDFGVPPGWAEAFATWASISIDGVDAGIGATLSRRVSNLHAGLLSPAPDLAVGNALWFSFVEQAYGLSAVRLTVQELSGAQPVALALDRAVRRASGEDLVDAFREFHVWALLTGERSDRRHFTFADRLEFPGFVTEAKGLPALSVHREVPIDTLGATQILLVPQETSGGMRVRFEGDLSARWDVDLVLVGQRGTKHRVALSVTPEQRSELVVPLDGLREAWLLVRNVESDDGQPHRYTYVASYEDGFPFEMTELRVHRQGVADDGVVVAWDTAAEYDLVGFNILRRVENGDEEQTVNPVWIPALGGFADETSYRYVDRTAEPGVTYVYRIQGITTSGLSSYSEPFSVEPLTPND